MIYLDNAKLPKDRLTFDGNFCDIAKCREERWGKYCPDGACSQRKVWERLKEYEDTTMSPTDVQEYKKFEDELIASKMTFNELLARASTGLLFTSVKDRLPSKDCQCLCVQKTVLSHGYVYERCYYHAKPFINSWEEEADPGFYVDGEDSEFRVDNVVLWVELPENFHALFSSAETSGVGCCGCKWDGKRHQKCSCCRRNHGMKDNYEGKTP